jgi:hypothetical protein
MLPCGMVTLLLCICFSCHSLHPPTYPNPFYTSNMVRLTHRRFAALNALGETGWRVNEEVYKIAKKVWDAGGGVAALPTREDVSNSVNKR